ncbi:uncharacterized protein STEHIDRAFT_106439 [Stereum hirsutum FP-91666 SS1]|uniref:uncharacterized protein n=1 Tax=Stereum hirsutum (strain FP-91666) TaxID=721885 RepID=UPI0004410248|nr:uncharacterized protein STEHIDRAFT_106439 [Stereum hirsutum FP-91666 SS1]EIM91702.1 hypothetical protein STEHIDRAFT_106439 [Stereum hirsutum FP-91666 SS1]
MNQQASSSQEALHPVQAPGPKPRTRTWRACEICRKRKIKCDGQDPCAFCMTSGKQCSFKETNDNASGSRQLTSNLETRLHHLEQLFTPMAKAFDQWAKNTDDGLPSSLPDNLDLLVPQSLPEGPKKSSFSGNGILPPLYKPSTAIQAIVDQPVAISEPQRVEEPRHASSPLISSISAGTRSSQDEPEHERERISDRLAHLAKDSLGNLRFIGGASSLVLVEALQSLQTPSSPNGSPDSAASDKVGKSAENLYGSLQYIKLPNTDLIFGLNTSDLPFFRPNMHFRRFDVLFVKNLHAGKPSSDHAFLSSLFAVFACAESLNSKVSAKPSTEQETGWKWTAPSEYAGLESMCPEKLFYSVQGLALLAICCAGWNTLSQSWVLAGQAIRAAQDLGLHRSPRRLSLSGLEKEIRRRIWWCVYGLDRVLSIALGRPAGTYDDDSDVEYPAEVDDEDVEKYCEGVIATSETSYMCGFVALLKIYVVAGKIVRTAHSLKLLAEIDATGRQVPELLQSLDGLLEDWVESLPPNIKFAANNVDDPKMLTLCLIAFFMYYSATINLHRPFISNPRDTSGRMNMPSLLRCVNAAKSCIRIGDMVKSTLPTSHHLAYAVQQIYAELVAAIITDAEKCRTLLEDMQDIWPGAKRCRDIVSDLLRVVKAKRGEITPPSLSEEQVASASNDYLPPKQQVQRSSVKRKSDSDPRPHKPRIWVDHPAETMTESHPNILGPGPSSSNLSFLNNVLSTSHPISDLRTSPLTPSSPLIAPSTSPPPAAVSLSMPPPTVFDFDLSSFDTTAPFSGYDFLGDDLSALLGVLMDQGSMAPQTPGTYDQNAQLLWGAWESGPKDHGEGDGGDPASMS